MARCLFLLCWLVLGSAWATTLPRAFADESDAAKPKSVDEYRAQNAAMQARVEGCRANQAACEARELPTRMTIAMPGGKTISLREDWLASALATAKTLPDPLRSELMAKATDRLQDEAREIDAKPAPVADAAKARLDADQILAGREFQYVQQETWWARRRAKFLSAFSTFLYTAFGRLPSAPWTVPLVEGGFLLAAAVGLVMWAWRTTQQQRVALSTSLSISNAGWQRESDDWARRAEEEAAAGAWREAVHCLYWAAIVMLEGKRLWRANRARTPREYLPLLESGSAVRTTLGGLTRIFERIWYGLRPATKADYEQAQALLETLKAGG